MTEEQAMWLLRRIYYLKTQNYPFKDDPLETEEVLTAIEVITEMCLQILEDQDKGKSLPSIG